MSKTGELQSTHEFGTDPDLEADDSVALLATPSTQRTTLWRAPWNTSAHSHSRQVLVVPGMLFVGLAMLGTYLWVDHAVHYRGSVVAPHRFSFTDAEEIVSLDGNKKAEASRHEKVNGHAERLAKENHTSAQTGTDAKVKSIVKDKHSIVNNSDANATAVLVSKDYESSQKNEEPISVKKGEWVFESRQKSNWTYIYTSKKQGWVPNWALNNVSMRNSTESGKKKLSKK